MDIKLSKENIAAIERCLNNRGRAEVLVRVEDGQVAVILLKRKKVN